jgi:hypothetical protein
VVRLLAIGWAEYPDEPETGDDAVTNRLGDDCPSSF